MRIFALGSGCRRQRMRLRARVSPLLNHGTALNSFSVLPGRRPLDINFNETLTGSPRGVHLRDAGERTIAGGRHIFTS